MEWHTATATITRTVSETDSGDQLPGSSVNELSPSTSHQAYASREAQLDSGGTPSVGKAQQVPSLRHSHSQDAVRHARVVRRMVSQNSVRGNGSHMRTMQPILPLSANHPAHLLSPHAHPSTSNAQQQQSGQGPGVSRRHATQRMTASDRINQLSQPRKVPRKDPTPAKDPQQPRAFLQRRSSRIGTTATRQPVAAAGPAPSPSQQRPGKPFALAASQHSQTMGEEADVVSVGESGGTSTPGRSLVEQSPWGSISNVTQDSPPSQQLHTMSAQTTPCHNEELHIERELRRVAETQSDLLRRQVTALSIERTSLQEKLARTHTPDREDVVPSAQLQQAREQLQETQALLRDKETQLRTALQVSASLSLEVEQLREANISLEAKMAVLREEPVRSSVTEELNELKAMLKSERHCRSELEARLLEYEEKGSRLAEAATQATSIQSSLLSPPANTPLSSTAERRHRNHSRQSWQGASDQIEEVWKERRSSASSRGSRGSEGREGESNTGGERGEGANPGTQLSEGTSDSMAAHTAPEADSFAQPVIEAQSVPAQRLSSSTPRTPPAAVMNLAAPSSAGRSRTPTTSNRRRRRSLPATLRSMPRSLAEAREVMEAMREGKCPDLSLSLRKAVDEIHLADVNIDASSPKLRPPSSARARSVSPARSTDAISATRAAKTTLFRLQLEGALEREMDAARKSSEVPAEVSSLEKSPPQVAPPAIPTPTAPTAPLANALPNIAGGDTTIGPSELSMETTSADKENCPKHETPSANSSIADAQAGTTASQITTLPPLPLPPLPSPPGPAPVTYTTSAPSKTPPPAPAGVKKARAHILSVNARGANGIAGAAADSPRTSLADRLKTLSPRLAHGPPPRTTHVAPPRVQQLPHSPPLAVVEVAPAVQSQSAESLSATQQAPPGFGPSTNGTHPSPPVLPSTPSKAISTLTPRAISPRNVPTCSIASPRSKHTHTIAAPTTATASPQPVPTAKPLGSTTPPLPSIPFKEDQDVFAPAVVTTTASSAVRRRSKVAIISD